MDEQNITEVRLRYAAEDAIQLADDLVTAGQSPLAERARELAVAIMVVRDVQRGHDAAVSELHSRRV